VRAIARLNVGGPTIQAITLTQRLRMRGYDTVLLRGREGPREGTMDQLADELGVQPLHVPGLQRSLGPHDAWALWRLVRILAREQPDVLHTHAAKAGTLGRAAALLLGRRGPRVRVHTFHGHVLAEYFAGWATRLFTMVERLLARSTTVLVAVSEEVKADLVRLRIAPADKIRVIPLGFALEPFVRERTEAAIDIRRELGLGDDLVVTIVARLVPIKRIDRFLRVAARLGSQDETRFLIVGDGDLAEELRASDVARALDQRLVWAGMRRDIPDLLAASDVVVLTSDNEGTPVSLIEAHAAGLPVVTTNVGGVASVVVDGTTGYVVDRDDEEALAARVGMLLGDPQRRATMGAAGRTHVLERFSLDRLVDDIDSLYRELLRDA
jgi:glycosyltransferase involved in cell wall biosynthesis